MSSIIQTIEKYNPSDYEAYLRVQSILEAQKQEVDTQALETTQAVKSAVNKKVSEVIQKILNKVKGAGEEEGFDSFDAFEDFIKKLDSEMKDTSDIEECVKQGFQKLIVLQSHPSKKKEVKKKSFPNFLEADTEKAQEEEGQEVSDRVKRMIEKRKKNKIEADKLRRAFRRGMKTEKKTPESGFFDKLETSLQVEFIDTGLESSDFPNDFDGKSWPESLKDVSYAEIENTSVDPTIRNYLKALRTYENQVLKKSLIHN